MPGEEETKVGSSAHLIAASTTTTQQTTIVPSSSSVTVKSPTTTATTTTTCATATSNPLSSLSSNLVGNNNNSGIILGGSGGGGVPPGERKKVASGSSGGSIVNVNTNRLSRVSLKKSEDGSLSVSILDNTKDHPTTSVVSTGKGSGGSGCGGGGGGEDVTDEEEDCSKLELELQFAGIDNETAELDLDEDDNNVDSNNGKVGGGGLEGGSGGGRSTRGSPTISTSGGGGVGGGCGPVGPTTATTTGGSRSGSVGVGGGVIGGGGLGTTTVETMDEEEDEDVEGGKTAECTEVIVPLQTLAEKCLFYVTAFFILLAVFSLFAFLFLVPFVIDPAFTTIFMEFDPEPAFCLTVSNVALKGSSNCNWTSCREGCTREMFNCTQIRVNYRRANRPYPEGEHSPPLGGSSGSTSSSSSLPPWSNNNAAATSYAAGGSSSSSNNVKNKNHYQQNSNNHLTNSNTAINKYNAALDPGRSSSGGTSSSSGYSNNKKRKHNNKSTSSSELTRSGSGDGNRDPLWDYRGADLFPNVKGCGYPPVIVCKDWYDKYGTLGTNFSCFYSKVDRGYVMTSYDMSRVILDLIFSMAIPIPSFIISVVYLIFAYFRIYNTDSSSSTARRASTAVVNQSSTNNNIQAGTAGGSTGDPDGDTSLSLGDEKTRIITKSTSRGLNAVDKLVPNSGKGLHHSQMIEMNDLNPQFHNPADGDLLLPNRRNNRAPERNGPNPAAKNKGEMNSNGQSNGGGTAGGNSRGGNGGVIIPPPPPETDKYLEPGVLPEKSNSLPPIELPPPPSSSTTKKSCKRTTMTAL